MNTFHVKYFIDAVRLGSVAESAKVNHVTHPAVSQAIRTLESSLNIELLTHKKRRFEVTPAGEAFFDRASAWLEDFNEIQTEMKSRGDDLHGHLILAGAQSLTADFLGPSIFKMKRKYPNVKIRQVFGDAASVRELVRQGKAQMGFLLDDRRFTGEPGHRLFSGHFVIAAREPRRKPFDRDLLVTSREKYEVQETLNRLREKYQREPEILMELVSWSLIRRFVLDEDVHGLLPDYVIKKDVEAKRLFVVPTGVAAPKYEMKAIWRGQAQPGKVARAYLEILEEICQKP